jgi:hypothetical protein
MLKVILISLIIFTVFVIGAVLALWLIISCYATDPDYWNRNIEPLLKDAREWVDAGNRLINYPPERFKSFM